MSTQQVLDIALSILLIWMAYKATTSQKLFHSVVFFISFGLILSLSWVRLNAPDIALAEAAIGSGLTGVLLLDAVHHTSKKKDSK